MALFKDIVDCVFTDTDEVPYPIGEISAVQISRGGKRISHCADDCTHVTLVDITDHSSTVVIYLKDFPVAVGSSGAGAQGIPLGTAGTLTLTVKSADGGDDVTFVLGDGANTFARFMGGGAQPKHADIECAGTMTFRGYCPAGDTGPLAQG